MVREKKQLFGTGVRLAFFASVKEKKKTCASLCRKNTGARLLRSLDGRTPRRCHRSAVPAISSLLLLLL